MADDPDYYFENGFMVFTKAYHLKRGYCCKSGCRHCPYGFKDYCIKKKVSVSWSGGKDSAFAFYKIISSGLYRVESIHTVFDESTRRVGLHGVPERLIERQADEMGLPLEKIYLPTSNNHSAYSTCMQTFYQKCSQRGIEGIVFGDIFLEDLKKYRLDLLRPSSLESFFPLWGVNTREMVNEFIDAGFKSVICAADSSLLDPEHVGRTIDRHFVDILPPQVDACGENGEFHSFAYDGPIFENKIPVKLGEVIQRSYSYQRKNSEGAVEDCESKFWFQELLL
jgi:uncharacterized protein (TIGR00290 family)